MISDNLTSNKIVLKSVFNKTGIKVYCNPARDPRTNRFPDCVKSVSSTGDIILTPEELASGKVWIKENEVFVIEDGAAFDLNDPYDKAKWEAIKFNPMIAEARDARDGTGNLLIDGSPIRYGIAELYIERPDQESTKRVKRKQLVRKAWNYIDEDPKGSQGRIMKTKMLGRNVNGQSDSEITEYLLSYAEEKPEMIIDLYTSENTPIRILLIDAKELGIIYVKNGMYTFADNVMLGATDQAAVAWLADSSHKNTLKLIQSQVYPEFNPSNLNEVELEKKAKEELEKKIKK